MEFDIMCGRKAELTGAYQ